MLSGGLWGTADFTGGVLSRRLPSPAVVAWSQAAGLLVVSAVALLVGAWRGPTDWLVWAVVAGLSGSASLVAFYAALASGTMGVVSPIASLGAVVPVGVGVLSGERPSGVQVVGIVVALAGAALASGPDLSASRSAPSRARPVLLAVVAAVGFGVTLTAIGRGSEHSTLMTLAGMRATSVTAFVVAAVVLGTVGGVRGRDVPVLAGLGVMDAGANFAFGAASTLGLLSITAVLGSLYPVATVLLARFVLHERLSRVQQVGVVAALGGVVLLSAG